MNACISSDGIKCFLFFFFFALVFRFQVLSFPFAFTTVIAHPCKTRCPRLWLNLGRFSVCRVTHAWRCCFGQRSSLLSFSFLFVPAAHWVWVIFTPLAPKLLRKTERTKNKTKKKNYSVPKKALLMGNNSPVEWALDHTRCLRRQCTFSLQGQRCCEAIFLMHKKSHNPEYNLHRIYSPWQQRSC